MDDWTKEISSDIKGMRIQLTDLVKQGAVNTTVLIEHERRSRLLEERVTPLEADYAFRAKLYTSVAGLVALLATVIAIYKSLN
jgi:hypothetical protein